MPSSYRALDREQDWPFFDIDCGFTPSDRDQIRPFTEAAATAFWNLHVSPLPTERHPFLLPAGHWLDSSAPGPDWLVIGEDETLSPARSELAHFLSRHFHLDLSAEVFFVLSRECTYAVPFGLFIAHCHDFLLLDDEGPFLLDPPSGAFAQFGPNGQLSVGLKAGAWN